MTPIIGHIYKCKWDVHSNYHYNVITHKSRAKFYGYLLMSISPTSGVINEFGENHVSTYDFNVPNAQITDLGPLEAFKQSNPEYFI